MKTYSDIREAIAILKAIERDIEDGISKDDLAKDYGMSIDEITELHHSFQCLTML